MQLVSHHHPLPCMDVTLIPLSLGNLVPAWPNPPAQCGLHLGLWLPMLDFSVVWFSSSSCWLWYPMPGCSLVWCMPSLSCSGSDVLSWIFYPFGTIFLTKAQSSCDFPLLCPLSVPGFSLRSHIAFSYDSSLLLWSFMTDIFGEF